MTDEAGQGQHGPWKHWSEFPPGEDKDMIEALWNRLPPPVGERRHWAIQIKGTNPISGYRVRRNPLEQTNDPD